MAARDSKRRVGLALGSGGARGWAHIGAIRALEAVGISPDVVCGASIGSLVGGAYAAGALDSLELWARQLTWRQVLGYFDLTTGGGLIRASRVMKILEEQFPDREIETLSKSFAAVATDLSTGREVCLRTGSLLAAVRASAALPGLVSPVRYADTWLLDGGLVNAIPVSVCRQLGAEIVIAVDLQTTLLRPEVPRWTLSAPANPADAGSEEASDVPVAPAAALGSVPDGGADEVSSVEGESLTFWQTLRHRAEELRKNLSDRGVESDPAEPPSIQEVLTKCMDIVQYRIARSRLAGDPPELLIVPKMPGIGTLDFHKANEAIECGRRAAERAISSLDLDSSN